MKIRLAYLLIIILLPLSALAEDSGFIQVKSAPGVQIFMNETLKETTNSDVGGLIIRNVVPGWHQITAERKGFQPQTGTLAVQESRIIPYQVHPLVPIVKIKQKENIRLRTGRLIIQSLPIECKLKISSLGLPEQNKTQDRWETEGVPAGEYKVVARVQDKTMMQKVQVCANASAWLFFNFVEDEVKDLGVEARAAAKRRDQETPPMRTQAGKDGLAFPHDWSFVPIIPGSFQMGSGSRQHPETITNGFWMSACETTQAQYKRLMKQNPSKFQGDQLPVETISWIDTQKFLRKLNVQERAAGRLPKGWEYRLPTQAQWEYAYRAGTSTNFCFGDSFRPLKDYAWFYENSRERTHRVGEKRPNIWGLFDMHGNVSEWCEDGLPKKPLSNGEQPELKSDPSRSPRVTRGSWWASSGSPMTLGAHSPDYRYLSTGFRVVAVSTDQ